MRGNIVAGDCSKIITEPRASPTTGPLHNKIPQTAAGAQDRSGGTIWTEDFSHDWFNGFMFGNGVKFHYSRTMAPS